MERNFPIHGWLGAGLISIVWPVNWLFSNPEPVTAYLFFPLWLGYCLFIDGLNVKRTGTSLLTRSKRKYIGLFFVSVPAWWLFEVLNLRMQNWFYTGRELFTYIEFFALSSLSFSTVIPAVFGTAEFLRSTSWLHNLGPGPAIRPNRGTTVFFALLGLVTFTAMLAWPTAFFPFFWLSLFFLLEPVNVWLGNRSLGERTNQRDWRPVIALWLGALVCGLFWEMWNWYSYPKWVYEIPWGDFFRIFEMPLLGYGGYLPFGMELFALYHLLAGLFGDKKSRYVTDGLYDSPVRESS